MRRFRILSILCLLIISMAVIFQPASILAQDEEETIPESLEMSAKYPKIEITSGGTAEFEVELNFTGEFGGEARVFDLVVIAPKDWGAFIRPSYSKDKKIASVQLSPGSSAGERILVQTVPAYWLKPEAGEYPVTLEATSGEVHASYELTVVVKAKYVLSLVPSAERYNTTATAGKDNYFSIEVQNSSSATMDDIKLSTSKPEDWLVVFTPEKIDSMAAGDSQTVNVNITPAAKTIAGDYLITITASGKQTSSDGINIRVTVETPTIWGWVGVIIVVVVIGGLVYTFRRFSRR